MEYSSVVEAVDGRVAMILFIDVLEKAGMKHTYSSRQRITISDAGLIESIQHEDIQTETVAVRAFMDRVGVAL